MHFSNVVHYTACRDVQYDPHSHHNLHPMRQRGLDRPLYAMLEWRALRSRVVARARARGGSFVLFPSREAIRGQVLARFRKRGECVHARGRLKALAFVHTLARHAPRCEPASHRPVAFRGLISDRDPCSLQRAL
eukprot:7391608-Prymnesium_polylepis.3